MKLIRYLLYRIANHILAHFSLKKGALPFLLWERKTRWRGNRIVFDFSHGTSHLGDRLFFLPVIFQLQAAGYAIALARDDKLTESLFNSILRMPLVFDRSDEIGGDLVVIPKPSWLDLRGRYSHLLAIDFTDVGCADVLTRQLVSSMNNELCLGLKIDSWIDIKKPVLSELVPSEESGDYFIFNNYIDSGGFRRHFVDESVLITKARELKQQGYKIIHIGSLADKRGDAGQYDFVDIDLRGATVVEDLPALLNDPRILGVVSYDNVLMHLAGIFRKKAYILFRGRIGKKAYQHHISYVNNTFFESACAIEYLN